MSFNIRPDYKNVLMISLGFLFIFLNLCFGKDLAFLSYKNTVIYGFKEDPLDENFQETKTAQGTPFGDQNGEVEKKLVETQQALEITPDNDELSYKLALLYYNKKDFEYAKERFEQLIDRSAKNIVKENSFFFLGLIAAKQENYQGAKYYFSEAVRINKKNYNAYINLGIVAFLLKDQKTAGESFYEVLRFKKDEVAYFYMGLVKYEHGRKELAAADLKSAKALKNDHVIEEWLDKMLKEDERYQNLLINPLGRLDQAKFYDELGWLYLDYGKTEKARASFEKAIEVDPAYWMAYGRLSEVYLYEGDFRKAEEYAFKVIDVDSSKIGLVYSAVGRIRVQAGQWAEAKTILKKAVEVSTIYEEWYPRALLGQVYVAEGDIEKAEKELGYCQRHGFEGSEVAELDLKIQRYKRNND